MESGVSDRVASLEVPAQRLGDEPESSDVGGVRSQLQPGPTIGGIHIGRAMERRHRRQAQKPIRPRAIEVGGVEAALDQDDPLPAR